MVHSLWKVSSLLLLLYWPSVVTYMYMMQHLPCGTPFSQSPVELANDDLDARLGQYCKGRFPLVLFPRAMPVNSRVGHTRYRTIAQQPGVWTLSQQRHKVTLTIASSSDL